MRPIFLALPSPLSVAFAVGAFAGLRTAEVLDLEWREIDLTAGRIHVQRQVQEGEMKILEDDESRIVPIQSALAPILKRWHLKTGGAKSASSRSTCARHLELGLAACKLPRMKCYHATRHTFARVLRDGSIDKLATRART